MQAVPPASFRPDPAFIPFRLINSSAPPAESAEALNLAPGPAAAGQISTTAPLPVGIRVFVIIIIILSLSVSRGSHWQLSNATAGNLNVSSTARPPEELPQVGIVIVIVIVIVIINLCVHVIGIGQLRPFLQLAHDILEFIGRRAAPALLDPSLGNGSDLADTGE
jgi:hypothetical protein